MVLADMEVATTPSMVCPRPEGHTTHGHGCCPRNHCPMVRHQVRHQTVALSVTRLQPQLGHAEMGEATVEPDVSQVSCGRKGCVLQ